MNASRSTWRLVRKRSAALPPGRAPGEPAEHDIFLQRGNDVVLH